MQRRRRKFARPTWQEQIEILKAKVAEAPLGKEREELKKKIRQLENASHVSEWLASPSIRMPP